MLTAIGNHGEGSFCVAFQTSIDAVRWATDVQNALLKAEWPEVRVICSTGCEAQAHDRW